ncbi:MAG TPA: FtsX-like permease family protein [Terriglobales bacterium]|nr:FtsX-like permease family protein [Terriglobales bacterium]
MKYLALVLANLKRKKVRTVLTVGSFAAALFLFGLLIAVRGAFNQGVAVAGADRLIVINRVSLIQPLPISYRERIQRVPGVKAVTFATWFGGVYQDERNFFPQMVIEASTWREMYPEFLIPEAEWAEFLKDRQACIAGEATAKRFGWKVGDRIPIKGTYLPGVWEFNLCGIYRGARPDDDTTQFWFRRDYFEEKAPAYWKGIVGWYIVKVANPDAATRAIAAIDETFSNSPYETKTETEKSFAAAFVKQIGNIEFLILSIGAVVFFTLLLVTGNTMAIAVRERTGELAVLKTVGFGDTLVLWLVMGEALIVALVGGALGILAAKAAAPRLSGLIMGARIFLPVADLVRGVGLALVAGALAGALPALSAMRLRVVDALRRV